MASTSNQGGPSSVKGGMSKGGSIRVQGQLAGASRGEGPSPSGKGDKGKGGMRPNGMQPAGLGGEGEAQNYRKSYATNKESMKPTKSGGVR